MNANPLIEKLAAVRNRIRLLLAGNSLCLFVATFSVVAAASFLLDWVFQLPFGARLVMLLIMVGVMARGAYQSFLKPFSLPLSDDAVALHVQAKNPQYGDSLISAIQLSRSLSEDTTESRSMIAATIAEATNRLKGEDFRKSVTASPLVRPFLTAAVLGFVVLLYAGIQPAHAKLWVNRCIFLGDQQWPADTILHVRIANLDLYRHEIDDEGNFEVWVPEGSAILIEARAEGIVPNAVRLHKFGLPRESGDRPITIEIAGQMDSDLFEYRFGRVNESFGFYVEGSDDNDERPYFRVHVRTAPKISELLVDKDFPDYINDVGREDREGLREYNVVGPRGTEIAMSFRTSADVTSFEIILDDKDEDPIRLEPEPNDPRLFVWEFQLDDDHFYTYKLVGANGAPSREAPNFNITSQPDVPPEIAIERPDTSTVDVTANAVVPLKFRVVDDYRVGETSFRWDNSREGDFAQRRVFQPEEIQVSEELKDASIFTPLLLKDLKIKKEDGLKEPAIGDRFLLKLEAKDTRSTSLAPDPNTTVYPSLIVMNVREASEIERDLTRTQIRIKGQISRIENDLAIRNDVLKTLIANINEGKEKDAQDTTESIHSFISSHALLASGLDEAARGFVRVFDGYLFNKIDDTNLTESLIAAISAEYRKSDRSHLEHVAVVLPKLRNTINSSEAMGKLALIMDEILDCSANGTRGIDEALKLGLESESSSNRAQELSKAQVAQTALLKRLRAILEKMEDWEDFQDVIQSLKDIIELEKGLQNRIKKIAK